MALVRMTGGWYTGWRLAVGGWRGNGEACGPPPSRRLPWRRLAATGGWGSVPRARRGRDARASSGETPAVRRRRACSMSLAVQEELVAQPGELAKGIFPLRHPVVDVAAALDQLAVLRAAGQEVDGQAVGHELVRLRAPLELVRVHVPCDFDAP